MTPTREILTMAPAIIRSCYGLFLLLPFNIFSTYYFQALLKPKASFIVSVAKGFSKRYFNIYSPIDKGQLPLAYHANNRVDCRAVCHGFYDSVHERTAVIRLHAAAWRNRHRHAISSQTEIACFFTVHFHSLYQSFSPKMTKNRIY